MGTEPSPGFGNDCDHCFAPGKTPDKFIFSITGIKEGNLWAPGMRPPPNGTHDVPQSPGPPCVWNTPAGNEIFSLALTEFVSRYVINFYNPFMNVFDKNEGPCTWFATNHFDDPANRYYYGGSIQAWIV